jgi:hypothetical protein
MSILETWMPLWLAAFLFVGVSQVVHTQLLNPSVCLAVVLAACGVGWLQALALVASATATKLAICFGTRLTAAVEDNIVETSIPTQGTAILATITARGVLPMPIATNTIRRIEPVVDMLLLGMTVAALK